jgi:hypothetical protein
MAVQSDVEYFARLVDALEPWLDQVVIIGGWAHRLYRLHQRMSIGATPRCVVTSPQYQPKGVQP